MIIQVATTLRRRCAVLLMLVLVLAPPLPAGAQNLHHELGAPELTVLVTPVEPWLQQQVVQSIRLESALPFDALEVHLGDVEGAEIVELVRPSVREFESWGVRGHVYETSRAIFPTRSGPLRLPAVHIVGATSDRSGRVEPFERRGEPVALEVRPRAGDLDERDWLVASAVTMSEQWSTPPAALRTGQIATRTLRVRAAGVAGEHIPPLTMPVSQGIEVAAHEPVRRTEITDIGLVGYLEQTFDVRVATAQTTDISGIYLPWWHGAAGTAQRATARAYRIEPLPADVEGMVKNLLAEARVRHESRQRELLHGLYGVAGLLVLLLVLARLPGRAGRAIRRGLGTVADAAIGRRDELPDIGYPDTEGPGPRRG